MSVSGGEGPRVALVDSGISAAHPHVGPCLPGASFLPGPGGSMVQGADTEDRIGHGTACAAAILERLPSARLVPVRIFDRRLEATAAQLARAIDWAVDRDIPIVALCLAVRPDLPHPSLLVEACRRAAARGTLVVTARPPCPGLLDDLPEVLPVGADTTCPPDRLRPDPDHPGGLLACPFARSAPGIPREANLHGPSLAAARVAGLAGRILQAAGPRVTVTIQEVLAALLEGAEGTF